MKKYFLTAAFVTCTMIAIGQTKENKVGLIAGGFIQHYNGNLGNSFFQFNTCCFGGYSLHAGIYISRSFDLTVGGSYSHFGYCQTDGDLKRLASVEQSCPGCSNGFGMGDLRCAMASGNVAFKYKFANGYLLPEQSILAPYLYLGFGMNYLSDNMGRQCVNVGTHMTINGGAGVTYNLNDRFNIGYGVGMGCFPFKKVYNTNAITINNDEETKFEKRKDIYMQNTFFLGVKMGKLKK